MTKDNELFENALIKVIGDPEVQKNPKLSSLLKGAITKTKKDQSVQSIASNLAVQIKSNFSEAELPKSVIDLQLALQKFTAVGGSGMVAFLNKFAARSSN